MRVLEDGSQLPFARPLASALRDVRPRPFLLLAMAGLPVLAAVWGLATPGRVLSNAMTWDFVFNLAGAWHVYVGHVAHVDFHEPLGQLNFLLTAIGFHLVGPGPQAFIVAVALVVCGLFLASFLAALPRLPAPAAAVFVVMVCFLALMPVNVGEKLDHYSFAMSYNRYCWAAFSILALILFVPRRNGHGSDALDLALGAVLLVAMFYLKITYFAAGLGSVAFAVMTQPHVARRWKSWLAICAVLAANALAPHSRPYLLDILGSAQGGAVRAGLMMHARNFFSAIGEYAPYIAGLILALWMSWTGRASSRLPLVISFLLAISLILLTQNTQSAGLPSTVVIVMVLYDRLRESMNGANGREAGPLLLTLLAFPLLAIGAATFSIGGYHAKASRQPALFVVEDTRLAGLAVPAEDRGAFVNFSRGAMDFPLRDAQGERLPRYELSQFEYVMTLLEAADLLAGRRPGGIAVLDQVNPLPFMLGWVPARGADLWSYWSVPSRPDAELFGDVTYVLVPKFPSDAAWSAALAARHERYVSEHFVRTEETASWRLYAR